MHEARALTSSAASGEGDVVLAALHLASEDDAVKTRTHIALPVSSFSARLDAVANVSAARAEESLHGMEWMDAWNGMEWNGWMDGC
jgi:hypothetical protein